MKQAEAHHYLKVVEWSDEDDCYIGSALPLIGQCCHGKDDAKVFAELSQIVDEWMEVYKKDGKPLPEGTTKKVYSGTFNLRVPPDVHKALAIRAATRGESLNAYCEKVLEHEVGA